MKSLMDGLDEFKTLNMFEFLDEDIYNKSLKKDLYTTKDIEKILKEYYITKKKIDILNHKLGLLKTKEKFTLNKIETDDITLTHNIQGIRYGNVKVQTSNNGSPQDSAIDKAYELFIKQINKVRYEIAKIQIELDNIILNNTLLDYYLDSLEKKNEINYQIVKQCYKNEKPLLEIALNLNIDISTVTRRKSTILKEIIELMSL